MRFFLHRKPTVGAALLAAVSLAAVGADAAEFFSRGEPRATAALKRGPGFEIRGDLGRPLAPGVSRQLNLKLRNPYRFGLKVKQLRIGVSVDRQHAAAGCRASSNFNVTRLARRAYPIRLRPRRTRTLRALGIRRLPRVTMRNLRVNQDACKGAKLRLRYAGDARRWRRAKAR